MGGGLLACVRLVIMWFPFVCIAPLIIGATDFESQNKRLVSRIMLCSAAAMMSISVAS